jgi:hypothetical protein
MECLSLGKMVGLMEVRQKEQGQPMPKIQSVVQVSAVEDR